MNTGKHTVTYNQTHAEVQIQSGQVAQYPQYKQFQHEP